MFTDGIHVFFFTANFLGSTPEIGSLRPVTGYFVSVLEHPLATILLVVEQPSCSPLLFAGVVLQDPEGEGVGSIIKALLFSQNIISRTLSSLAFYEL